MYEQYKFVNQTQLAEMFVDATSHKIGKWLQELGLKTTGRKPNIPTFTAQEEGFVSTSHNGRGTGWFHVWHREKTVQALVDDGHQLVEPVELA